MNVKKHRTSNQLLKMYKAESDSRLARRIHGIYLAKKGHSCPEIMQIIGVSRKEIQQRVQKYNNSGIEALKDKPRPSKPTTLRRHMEQKFYRHIEKGPSKQDGVSVLNGPAIKRILEREFRIIQGHFQEKKRWYLYEK